MQKKIPFCSEILTIFSLSYIVITIGIGFPVPIEFANDSDSILAEDLEFFANINRVFNIFK